MDIKQFVRSLVSENGTFSPFEIAENKGIIIQMEPLGTIRGYYSKALRTKFIHINCDLDEYQQKFTCAHELGHALLHPDLSTPFLRESTLFSVDKLEVEANRFAACLCYPPNLLAEEYEGCTTAQIAEILNLPLPLIEYTLK